MRHLPNQIGFSHEEPKFIVHISISIMVSSAPASPTDRAGARFRPFKNFCSEPRTPPSVEFFVWGAIDVARYCVGSAKINRHNQTNDVVDHFVFNEMRFATDEFYCFVNHFSPHSVSSAPASLADRAGARFRPYATATILRASATISSAPLLTTTAIGCLRS